MQQNDQTLQLLDKLEKNSRKQTRYARIQCVFSIAAALLCLVVLVSVLSVMPRLNALAESTQQVALHPGAIGKDDPKGKGTAQLLDGFKDGLHGVVIFAIDPIQKPRSTFGIGLGAKNASLLTQRCRQLGIVLNNTIVDHRQSWSRMWMSVVIHGGTVRSPTRMSDATGLPPYTAL